MAGPAETLENLQNSILQGVDTDTLKSVLAKRGVIVEIATKTGPDESWFYGSDGLGRCLSCKFFVLTSAYKAGRGECHIRSVAGDEFPKRHAGNWCGEQQSRLATQGRFHEPPVEGEQPTTPHVLIALDYVKQHMVAYVEAHEKSGARVEYPVGSAKRLLSLIEDAQRLGFKSEQDMAEFENLLGQPLPSFLGGLIMDEIDKR